jgi:prepilin-type N-terminal cleavage/methylation domain-containing protein
MKLFSKGFTLIELMITVAIIGVVSSIALTTISTVIKSSSKTNVVNRVKQNGDNIIDAMTRDIRGATDVCVSPDRATLTLYSTITSVAVGNACPSGTTSYVCSVGTSSSNGSLTKNGIHLTNNTDLLQGVKVANCNFIISGTSLPKTVTINLTLAQPSGMQSTAGDPVSVNFDTQVSLRSFGN